jgi:hypothetical protein
MPAERQVRGDATRMLRERRNDFAPESAVYQYSVDEYYGRTFSGVTVTHGPLLQPDLFDLIRRS